MRVKMRRNCHSLNRILHSRTAALIATFGLVLLLYYMHYYHGMSLHVALPGLSTNNADKELDAPIPIPKFDNLQPIPALKHNSKIRETNKKNKPGKVHSKYQKPKQQDSATMPNQRAQKDAPTKTPISRQQLRRRRGNAEFLPSINVTILHEPNLTRSCTKSRLIFATGSSALGDLPEGLPTAAIAANVAEAARKQRQAVRDTWASSLKSIDLPEQWRNGCVIFYALASDTGSQKLLLEESRQTQDLIILGASPDTFSDWSPHELDIISSAKVLFHLASRNQNLAGYTIRTNHKAFWNVKKLVKFLQGLDSGAEGQGKLHNTTHMAPLRIAGKSLRSDWVHRDPLDPSYTSKRQFPDQMYPESALDNPGYAISNSALKAMSNLTSSIPLVYYRETYLTGILRQNAGIQLEPVADIKASRAVPVSPCHYRLFIATPTVEAQEMQDVWHRFNNPNHKCSYNMIEETDD